MILALKLFGLLILATIPALIVGILIMRELNRFEVETEKTMFRLGKMIVERNTKE